MPTLRYIDSQGEDSKASQDEMHNTTDMRKIYVCELERILRIVE